MASSIGHGAWLLLCALLPISGAWVIIPLLIAVIALLASRIGRPFPVHGRLLWPLFAFYALHAIGMAWSADIEFGLFDLQIKLGLVLLPLAAGALVASRGPRALRESMIAFACGIVVAFALSMTKAMTCFGEKGWTECFTQSYLSFDLHPSYAAWYAVWAVAHWSHALIHGEVPARWRWVAIAFVFVSAVFAIMLVSKSGLVCLVVVLVLGVVTVVRRVRGARRWLVLGAVAVAIAVPAILLRPVIVVRTQLAVDAVGRLLAGDQEAIAGGNGNDERLIAWICSAELIASDALGAGTGDVKHALVNCYERKSAATAAERRLNSHSQFLQGGVALGWAGLVLALLVALLPLTIAIVRKEGLLAVFMLLYLINAAIESVLEVQAGVVFFAIFLGLLAARLPAGRIGARSSHA